MTKLTAIILAAGKGTRMKSAKAKVLHEIFYAPMIHYVIRAVLPLKPQQSIVVVGHQEDLVREALSGFQVDFARQTRMLGTGDAVLSAETVIHDDTETVMILCGDTPLISSDVLQRMYEQHQASGADLTLMTTILAQPANYGRIISQNGQILAIVEESDADDEQKKIGKVNAGIYCVSRRFLFAALKKIGTDNNQGEMYLTDIIGIAAKEKRKVQEFINDNAAEVLGVNSRFELAEAHQELLMRRNRQLMEQGVTILQPQTVSVEDGVEIGNDSIINRGVELCGASKIGRDCRIGSGAVIMDSILGDAVAVGAGAYLKNQQLAAGTVVAPYSQLVSG